MASENFQTTGCSIRGCSIFVGPSLKVLQKRAKDVGNLLLPYEPTEILTALARHREQQPNSNLEKVHFFPLGGIVKTVEFADKHLIVPNAA